MSNAPQFILFGSPEIPHVDKDVDPASVVEGNPAQKSWLYSNEETAGARFGVWDCQAGKFRAKMDGIVEFCCIIEGSADITNLADGSTRTVSAGDAFLMQEGLDLEWHVPNYIKKYFSIVDV